MEINIPELRERPRINWTVKYEWMSKMTNEELEAWQNEFKEEVVKSIIDEKREVKDSEVEFRILKEADLIERDYLFIQQGLK